MFQLDGAVLQSSSKPSYPAASKEKSENIGVTFVLHCYNVDVHVADGPNGVSLCVCKCPSCSCPESITLLHMSAQLVRKALHCYMRLL